jgi:hypothetical protein
MLGYSAPRPAEVVPGPAAQMKKPKILRRCRWRGWVDPKIIDRTDIKTAIEKKHIKLTYFALFDVVDDDGWQPFEMHTGTGKRESEVARLLGHDFNAHRAKLKLTPFLRHEKFSDTIDATWLVGERPDFDPNVLLNSGLGFGEEIEEENMGDENMEENTGKKIDTVEEAYRREERREQRAMDSKQPAPKFNTNLLSKTFDDNRSVGTGKTAKPSSTDERELDNFLCFFCNFLCFWKKPKPNARYA